MKIYEFVTLIENSIEAFNCNTASDLEMYRKDYTAEELMDMFLRWSEWQTDMHDEYWGDK